MKTFKFDGYKVTLQNTGKVKDNHTTVEYWFRNRESRVIFHNSDFGCPFQIEPESRESAINLLGFLTCRLHDVEEDYFKDYTEDQIAFRDSSDCENLQVYCYDEENQ